MYHLFPGSPGLRASILLLSEELAFEEEEVVYMMTSEFLTLIVTFLNKKLQSSLLQGRWVCQGASFVKLSEIRARFVTLTFGNSPGSGCAHMLCSVNPLSAIMLGS